MENSKKTVKGQDGSAKTELSFLILMFMLLAIGFAFALTNTQYSVMMASLIVVGGTVLLYRKQRVQKAWVGALTALTSKE